MKKYILFLYILVAVGAMAQTRQLQNGVVKTRGRMVNGKLVPGNKIAQTLVCVRGRSAVLSGDDGAFSFPVTTKSFIIDSVKKKDYALIDIEACRQYQYPQKPFVLLMEKPEKQQAELLAAERKIRRNLQRQLQDREDEIDNMRNTSQQEKDSLLQLLYQQQGDNERLIADMAKRYSTLDYDQLDEFYRQVSYFIENGELIRADSLLRSRGDINAQVKIILQQGQTIQEKEEQLDKAKEVHKKDIDEAARRCYGYYEEFFARHQNDSAAYYLELRASIDTTNVEWLFEAANFYVNQNNTAVAESYYKRILRHINSQPESTRQFLQSEKSATLNNLAILYEQTRQIEQSEECYHQALIIRRTLAKEYPDTYEPFLAQTLCNLGMLYMANGRTDIGEEMLSESLEILNRLYQHHPQKFQLALAATLSSISSLYINTPKQHLRETGERFLRQAIELFRSLAQDNPVKYRPNIAATLSNLALLYHRQEQLEKCRTCYEEAINIYLILSDENPKVYKPYLLSLSDNLHRMATELNKLGTQRDNSKQTAEGKHFYLESLAIYQTLAKFQPDTFRPFIARELGNLSYNAILSKEFEAAEIYAREGISVDSSKVFIYGNLAEALLLQGKEQEAMSVFQQYRSQLKISFLDDYNQLINNGIINKEQDLYFKRVKKWFLQQL